jgi:hypothetical protein
MTVRMLGVMKGLLLLLHLGVLLRLRMTDGDGER